MRTFGALSQSSAALGAIGLSVKFLLTGQESRQLGWELERRLATAGDLVRPAIGSTMDLSQSAEPCDHRAAHDGKRGSSTRWLKAVDRAQSEPALALRTMRRLAKSSRSRRGRAGALLVTFHRIRVDPVQGREFLLATRTPTALHWAFTVKRQLTARRRSVPPGPVT